MHHQLLNNTLNLIKCKDIVEKLLTYVIICVRNLWVMYLKIKLNIKLKNNDIQEETSLIATLDENEIRYIDNQNIVSEMKIDLFNDILTRDNKDYTITYNFKLNEVTDNKVLVKDLNKELSIKIKTYDLLKDNNKYKVKYEILDSNEIIEYELKY